MDLLQFLLNDQGSLPIETINGLLKFNSWAFTFQFILDIELLCKMRHTCKFQSLPRAPGILDFFDLLANWLLETRRPPGLKSPGTLTSKHLKTNKVAETDTRPRQNSNHFAKLTPKWCEQTILPRYDFCYFHPRKHSIACA